MPGDPKECREHAANCVEMANASENDNDKGRLKELAASWDKLAAELERARAIIEKHKTVG